MTKNVAKSFGFTHGIMFVKQYSVTFNSIKVREQNGQ